MSASPVLWLGLAGGLAGAALAGVLLNALRRASMPVRSSFKRALTAVEQALGPLRDAGGVGGAAASDRDLRRTCLAAALAGLVVGWLVAGPISGLLGLPLSAWGASRTLTWRRSRHAQRLGRDAGPAALAIAEALEGGHSVRSSLGIAAGALSGPLAFELSRVGAELELGSSTGTALERLRERAQSPNVSLVVAAILVQYRAGGGLASLLRQIAATVEQRAQAESEARAASAQARFTARVVLAMPFCAAALGELASPGLLGRVIASQAGLALLALALILQVGGATLIARLARVA